LIIRDDELKGFGIRATKSCISFIAERRVGQQVRRFTIGKYGPMMVDEARREARKILSGAAVVNLVQHDEAACITLLQVLENFLAVRKLRPNTVKSYTQITKRCLGDWLDAPITSITRDMVQTRHRDLTKTTKQGTSGEVQANMSMRVLRTLLNFAANNYETPNGQPILAINPVCRLSQNRSWHREARRRIVIPDHKLGDFYRAVMSLKNRMLRDYLLVLILTGLRRNEAANLRWTDIDLIERTLTVRAEYAKNKQEHILPLSDFLFMLLSVRKEKALESEYIFPGRDRRGHIIDSGCAIERVVKNTGCDFVLHDLRRTFVTTAAKLGVPHHIIKKLVNHITSSGATDGYIVIQVEHLRDPMAQITNRFLTLFGCSPSDWSQGDQSG
jgi:integrase